MSEAAIFLGKGGFVLFTFGLLIGAGVSKFRNPRMALSAHLTGVQTGPALIAVALFWSYLGVPVTWAGMLIHALLWSAYLLVAGLTLAAATGANRVLPIAGAGYGASGGAELIVAVLVLGSSVLMLLASLAICFFAFA